MSLTDKHETAGIKVSDQRQRDIYINHELDDLGLDPYTFRVYARLARRAGTPKGAFERISEMAEGCRMSERSVHKALRNLEAWGLVSKVSRPGSTSVYRLLDKSQWGTPAPDADPPLHEVQTTPAPGADIREQEKASKENETLSSSAKERSKAEPDTPSQSEAVGSLIEIWNEHRGTLPAANRPGGTRARKLQKMVKDLGLAEAKEILRKATVVVANDDFWKSKRFGLDNLLAGEKYIQRAEQYDAQQAEEAPPESVSLNVGDIVLARHSIGMKTVEMEGRVLEVGEKQIQVEFKRDEHTEQVRIPYRDFIRRVREAE